jgi:hypothetical protein
VFASADFDIVPKTLTFTAGTRYYRPRTAGLKISYKFGGK